MKPVMANNRMYSGTCQKCCGNLSLFFLLLIKTTESHMSVTNAFEDLFLLTM